MVSRTSAKEMARLLQLLGRIRICIQCYLNSFQCLPFPNCSLAGRLTGQPLPGSNTGHQLLSELLSWKWNFDFHPLSSNEKLNVKESAQKLSITKQWKELNWNTWNGRCYQFWNHWECRPLEVSAAWCGLQPVSTNRLQIKSWRGKLKVLKSITLVQSEDPWDPSRR